MMSKKDSGLFLVEQVFLRKDEIKKMEINSLITILLKKSFTKLQQKIISILRF